MAFGARKLSWAGAVMRSNSSAGSFGLRMCKLKAVELRFTASAIVALRRPAEMTSCGQGAANGSLETTDRSSRLAGR